MAICVLLFVNRAKVDDQGASSSAEAQAAKVKGEVRPSGP